MEIESRLLPCGLHVVGSPPSAAEAVATLVNIAEIDRPENDPPTAGLPGIMARSIGRRIEEIYANNNKVRSAVAAARNLHAQSTQIYPSDPVALHQKIYANNKARGPCGNILLQCPAGRA